MECLARWSWSVLAVVLAACGGTTVSGNGGGTGGSGTGGTGGSGAGGAGGSGAGGAGGSGTGGTGGTADAAAGSAGTAGTGGCPAGYADCNGDPSDGCETNLASDPANCGTCGHTCSSIGSTSCINGACQICDCPKGLADCNHDCSDGCEVDTQTDVNNCGVCGNACSAPHATAACKSGTCAIKACDPGFADCDGLYSTGCEIDTDSDPDNCGSCGNPCPSNNGGPPTCNAGTCTQMCCDQPGFALCGGDCATGSCTDLMIDPQNCGSCGHVCPTSAAGCPGSCTGGTCGLPACPAGTADCDCIASNGCESDLQTDPANCGMCGHACASGQSCVSGSCQ